MNGNVIRTITIRGTSEGLDKLQADLAKVAAGHKGVAVASEETDKSTLSLEQALKRQTLRLDEVARAQDNIARETKLADAATARGTDRPAAGTPSCSSWSTSVMATASKATAEFGKQTGLARHELINLGRQAQDVGVSLVSGQSPFMVLVQQGSQIADVFIVVGQVGRQFLQPGDRLGQDVPHVDGRHRDGHCGDRCCGGLSRRTQFVRASTTIEQALEKQEPSAEGRQGADRREDIRRGQGSQLNRRNRQQYETKRNLLDLQLN